MNPNTDHSILRPSFRTLCKFQGLVHFSFDTYYSTTNLILSEEKDTVIKERGENLNCTLSSSGLSISGYKYKLNGYFMSFSDTFT